MATPKANARTNLQTDSRTSKGDKPERVANVHYEVACIEKTESPDGANGRSWYRYVIEGGYGPLTGCRQGTQKQIAKYASDLAAELNVRSGLGTPSPWAPRQKKS